ncbi:hypothetical protein D3C75_345600 [compost metagenome]
MQLGQVISGEVHPYYLFTGNLRVRSYFFFYHILSVFDQLLAFSLHPHTFGIQQNLLTPSGSPRGDRVSHNRSDLAQCVVVFLCNTGVSGKNNIRVSIGDSFKIKSVGILEYVRVCYAQLVQLCFGPREQSAVVLNTEVRGREAYRNNTQCQRNVMVCPLNGNYTLRLALKHSLTQCSLDGDRILNSICSSWRFCSSRCSSSRSICR